MKQNLEYIYIYIPKEVSLINDSNLSHLNK